MPWLMENWGNPSSAYRAGREARKAVERAREQVAALVKAEPRQVVFTSGATEANNTALHAAVLLDQNRRHLVTSQVEHSAVLACCDYLERHHGIEVTRLGVDPEGRLDPRAVAAAIRPDTCLVSLMWANNETGVLFPVHEVAENCLQRGVPLHTDAVQAVAKVPVDFAAAGMRYLSLSGHKIGAPKGVGALILAEPERFEPLIHGGKQEHGHRGGTESVPLIVGLGMAAEVRHRESVGVWENVRRLRDEFEAELVARIGGASIHGRNAERLPNTSNIHLPCIDGDGAVFFLDQREICVSSGSACLESAIAPSHVVLAMTGSHQRASESLRVSLGPASTADELDQLLAGLSEFASIAV